MQPPLRRRHPTSTCSLRPKTVLLVEDNADNRTIYRTILEYAGYTLIEEEEVGCDGYLAKPVEPRRVMEEVERFLGPGRAAEA